MNNPHNPLSAPEIAVRVIQRQQKSKAIALIVIGVSYLVLGLLSIKHASPAARIGATVGAVAGGFFAFSGFEVVYGIRLLVSGNPTVKLLIDLTERIRNLESAR
jgi:hypothetical protein